MTEQSIDLEQLVADYLEGRPVDVPAEQKVEFDQAVQAHRALREMLDETIGATIARDRSTTAPPAPTDYDIVRELGKGGMGIVYLARQKSLNRHVALKVLRPGQQTFSPLVKRFLDEAQHLAQLRHPNIVSIHEVGQSDGEPFFTMDYVDGEPLSAVIARGPMSPAQAVGILRQVAAAIQHAHRQGIIHRDLKPGNVLIDRNGHAFVTDFGLARNVSQESNLTQSGELLGTPQYMAPEQARGQSSLVGEATDIHALGLLLFEMLTGRPAFEASSPADVLVKLLHHEPPALRTIDRRIPRDLETICLKALQKSPASRYPNASALVEDLRRYETGEPLIARRSSVFVRWARRSIRHWRIAAIVGVTALIVALVAPRLFDKSFDELMQWGNDEFRAGRPQVAAQIFQRALARGEPIQQAQALPRLVDAIRQIEEPKQAVDLALQVVEVAPQTSFEKHDFLVAQALVMAARAETPNDSFEPTHGKPSAKAQLAARRLSMFLEGPWGTPAEHEEAKRWYQAIERSLRDQFPTERWSYNDIVQLPTGSTAELVAQATDASRPARDRGKSAMAAGRLYEAEGDKPAALEQYRAALSQLRRVFPFVSGVASRAQATSALGPRGDAPECQLVSDLLAAASELDPEMKSTARGGVRLRLDHPELLGGLKVNAMLRMTEPDLAVGPRAPGTTRPMSRDVPLKGVEPGEVRVLDGTYQLSLSGIAVSWDSTADRSGSLIDISAEGWPATLDIRGEFVDLPPLVVRQLIEMAVLNPPQQGRVDLSRDVFTWQAVPGAAEYQVQLGYFVDIPVPTSSWFAVVKTAEPQLRIDSLTGVDRDQVAKHWKAGTFAGFRVAAFDAAGHRMATTVDDRRFLVAVPAFRN